MIRQHTWRVDGDVAQLALRWSDDKIDSVPTAVSGTADVLRHIKRRQKVDETASVGVIDVLHAQTI